MKTNYSFFSMLLLIITCSLLSSCRTYEPWGEYVDGIAVAHDNNFNSIYIDINGKPINRKARFNSAKDFSEGFGVVQFEDGLYGMVDKTINVVTSQSYISLESFNSGTAKFSKDGNHYGLLDYNMNEVVKDIYTGIGDYSDGMIRVYNDDGTGYLNENLELVIPCKYSNASDFSEGVAIVEYNYSKGLIDKTGKFNAVENVMSISPFKDGLAQITQKGNYGRVKYGFINKSGEIVIPCMYDKVTEPSEGLVGVVDWDGCKYLDYSGNDAFNQIFDSIEAFSNGVAVVWKNDVKYNLSRNGNTKAIDMKLNGRWKYSKPGYGVYTIKLEGSYFELWAPDRKIDSGTYTRESNTLSLNGRTVTIDLENKALIWGGDRYTKSGGYSYGFW